MLRGRVFLTGGTGSLGTAFLKRAQAESWPCIFTVYSRDEVKQAELKRLYPKYNYVLGDIRDTEWLAINMQDHNLVIHTAAYKQVPAAEVNSGQAISVNVIGSTSVARAAVQARVYRVIGVSTDKACAPVNCYGASKMLMEKLFQEANRWGQTTFNLVRYGNVLGSRGSVVPLFKQQAAQGFVTITDPNMTRFWMTLDDAVNLILLTIEHDGSTPGTIRIPKCNASTMLTLAEAVAPNVEIKVTGIRPGEKIHEKLIHSGESMHAFNTPGHFIIHPANSGYIGNLVSGYEYCSNTAPQLSVEQLRALI